MTFSLKRKFIIASCYRLLLLNQVGVFLGYLEVLGVAFCAFGERQYVGENVRRSPWSSYFMLCFCLLISSATSNLALGYINYPTKDVFRSCKVRRSICLGLISKELSVMMVQFTSAILWKLRATIMHSSWFLKSLFSILPCPSVDTNNADCCVVQQEKSSRIWILLRN